jgi:hypothetical protein
VVTKRALDANINLGDAEQKSLRLLSNLPGLGFESPTLQKFEIMVGQVWEAIREADIQLLFCRVPVASRAHSGIAYNT